MKRETSIGSSEMEDSNVTETMFFFFSDQRLKQKSVRKTACLVKAEAELSVRSLGA